MIDKYMIDKWLSMAPIPADKQRLLVTIIDNHYAKVHRETDVHIRFSMSVNGLYRLKRIDGG